jgi:hypothetical protein
MLKTETQDQSTHEIICNGLRVLARIIANQVLDEHPMLITEQADALTNPTDNMNFTKH